jgi:hypothetical protein
VQCPNCDHVVDQPDRDAAEAVPDPELAEQLAAEAGGLRDTVSMLSAEGLERQLRPLTADLAGVERRLADAVESAEHHAAGAAATVRTCGSCRSAVVAVTEHGKTFSYCSATQRLGLWQPAEACDAADNQVST